MCVFNLELYFQLISNEFDAFTYKRGKIATTFNGCVFPPQEPYPFLLVSL